MAHFSFQRGSKQMGSYRPDLQALLAPVVEDLGYELVGVEFHPHGRSSLLRVYIDAEDGVTVDDCARVSDQVSGILDVEDPISGHYTLEVSSPGLDRPLFVPAHFQRFTGRRARLHLSRPLAQRPSTRLTGVLAGLEGEDLTVEVDGQRLTVPIAEVVKARLIPEL